MTPRRIAVVGVSGAGKSTIARRLARARGWLYVRLDRLYWGEGRRSGRALRHRARLLLRGDAWIADGNYGVLDGMLARRCELIVWVDPSWARVVGRQIGRRLWRRPSGGGRFSGSRRRAIASLWCVGVEVRRAQLRTRKRMERLERRGARVLRVRSRRDLDRLEALLVRAPGG